MLKIKSVALVDGDIYDPEEKIDLPGHARFLGETFPEAIVFDYIYENRMNLISLIRQRCLLSQFSEDRILAEIQSVRNSGCDPHVIFTDLSEKLDFVSALQIRAGMIDLFNERNAEFWNDTVDFVRLKLNIQND